LIHENLRHVITAPAKSKTKWVWCTKSK